MARTRDVVGRFQVRPGKDFRLADVDPGDTRGVKDKEEAEERMARALERLGELQQRLYAQDSWAVLLVLQGMDAAGKDGVVGHVFAGVNPAGCHVSAFRAPGPEDLEHDFLWRAARALPERGRIGIFNRSYYEEVVTVRVNPQFLEKQRLPPRLVTDALWKERCHDIVAFERYLCRNGVLVRKVFLHLSRAEQRRRFLERIDHPEKNWKFRMDDVEARAHWDEYQRHWGEAIARTSSAHAPWLVVPADHKWFTRLVVSEALVCALEELELDFPTLDAGRRAELARARRALEAEDGKKKKSRR